MYILIYFNGVGKFLPPPGGRVGNFFNDNRDRQKLQYTVTQAEIAKLLILQQKQGYKVKVGLKCQ